MPKRQENGIVWADSKNLCNRKAGVISEIRTADRSGPPRVFSRIAFKETLMVLSLPLTIYFVIVFSFTGFTYSGFSLRTFTPVPGALGFAWLVCGE